LLIQFFTNMVAPPFRQIPLYAESTPFHKEIHALHTS
jgi:hypothetical protein